MIVFVSDPVRSIGQVSGRYGYDELTLELSMDSRGSRGGNSFTVIT